MGCFREIVEHVPSVPFPLQLFIACQHHRTLLVKIIGKLSSTALNVIIELLIICSKEINGGTAFRFSHTVVTLFNIQHTYRYNFRWQHGIRALECINTYVLCCLESLRVFCCCRGIRYGT